MMSAVRFARADQMDLAIGIPVGGSIQVALLVTPVLVLAGFLMGQPLDLLFHPFAVAGVLIAGRLTVDGETDWLEGVMLLAVYVMLATGFYFLPAGA